MGQYLANSLHDLASRIQAMIVIAATRTTLRGADTEVLYNQSLYLDLKKKLPNDCAIPPSTASADVDAELSLRPLLARAIRQRGLPEVICRCLWSSLMVSKDVSQIDLRWCSGR